MKPPEATPPETRATGQVPAEENPAPRSPRRGASASTVVLALAVVALIAAVGWVYARGPAAGASAVRVDTVSAAETATLTRRAADLTGIALSYRASRFDSELQAALPTMTAAMQRRYRATMATVRPTARRYGIDLRAHVVALGVISANAKQARLLGFVDQTTSSRSGAGTQSDQSRVLITLTKTSHGWLLSDLHLF